MDRKIKLVKWFFIFLFIFQCAYARRILEEPKVHYLNAGDSAENNNPGLKTYCHNATSKYLTRIWKTMTMHLDINSEAYTLYDGKTPHEVLQKHDENQRTWSFNLFDTRKHKRLKINPFEDVCIGVYTDSSTESGYIMSMTETRINVWILTMMVIGVLTFWCAKTLSRNSVFYYACGVLFGVITSILILIYITGKLIPRGKFIYLIFAGFLLARTLSENAEFIAMQYGEWVMWYILTISLISFIICYRFGPVTNIKTKQLMQWFLQVAGLVLVYTSSYFHEASLSCCVVLLLLYNFPKPVLE